jgi:hypothetical protein
LVFFIGGVVIEVRYSNKLPFYVKADVICTKKFSKYILCPKCHNYLYSSPNILRVIRSRRMRWAGHVARMGEGRGMYKVLVGKPD